MNGLERDQYLKVLLNCYTHDSVTLMEGWLGKKDDNEEGVTYHTSKGAFLRLSIFYYPKINTILKIKTTNSIFLSSSSYIAIILLLYLIALSSLQKKMRMFKV